MKALGVLVSILLVCIAGSDGPWFPWINLLSAGSFMLIVGKCLPIINKQ